MAQTSSDITKREAWISAMRPRTLPLATATILMGGFLAAADGRFRWPVMLLSLLTAVFLQILSNLANDYGDAVHGADSSGRSGPKRAVQSGAISAAAMRQAMILFGLFSVMSGLALLWIALGAARLVLVILFVGLGGAAIVAAVTYTAGKRPYGYAGLGDLAVLLFFGWIGVLGTYFLQAQQLAGVLWLPATSCGLLAVAVLNVNNIRDIESDRAAGKFSLPVRLGRARAVQYHWLLLFTAVLTAVIYVLLAYRTPWQFLFLLSVPLLIRNGTAVARITDARQLNPYLKQMVFSTLAFILTFGIGQLL